MEIEAKYTVLDQRAYTTLTRLHQIGDFRVEEAGTRSILDTYLDTDDRAIISAGYACRRRRQDGETTITVKSLSSGTATADDTIHRRMELQIPIDEERELRPELWPEGPLRHLVLEVSGGQTLTEILDIEQARQVRYLLSAEGTVVIELDLDRVEIRGRPAASGQATKGKSRGGQAANVFTELEVELMEAGSEADLQQVMAHLTGLPGLSAQPTSKFERGLAIIAGGATSNRHLRSLRYDDTVGEAVRRLLRPLFLKMQAHEAGTYAGEDTEQLHDMRVAIRRMRTLLRITESYLDPAALEPACSGLRKTARILGAVRDMDVFREKTEGYLTQSAIPSSAFAPLMHVWNVEYARRRNEMLVFLGQREYARFKKRFWAQLKTGLPTRGKPARIRLVGREVVTAQLRRLQRRSASLTEPVKDYEAYHQLRIDAKHLRYSLEFFQSLLGAEALEAIEVLKHLQDHFGDLQDAVVAASHLRAIAAYGTWVTPEQSQLLWRSPDAPEAADLTSMDAIWTYLGAREAEIEALTEATPQVWQEFQDRGVPKLVQTALAGIKDRDPL